jgi:hypothetical protein
MPFQRQKDGSLQGDTVSKLRINPADGLWTGNDFVNNSLDLQEKSMILMPCSPDVKRKDCRSHA